MLKFRDSMPPVITNDHLVTTKSAHYDRNDWVVAEIKWKPGHTEI